MGLFATLLALSTFFLSLSLVVGTKLPALAMSSNVTNGHPLHLSWNTSLISGIKHCHFDVFVFLSTWMQNLKKTTYSHFKYIMLLSHQCPEAPLMISAWVSQPKNSRWSFREKNTMYAVVGLSHFCSVKKRPISASENKFFPKNPGFSCSSYQ